MTMVNKPNIPELMHRALIISDETCATNMEVESAHRNVRKRMSPNPVGLSRPVMLRIMTETKNDYNNMMSYAHYCCGLQIIPIDQILTRNRHAGIDARADAA